MPRPKILNEEQKKKNKKELDHKTYLEKKKIYCDVCEKYIFKYGVDIHNNGIHHKYKELLNSQQ